MDDKFLYVSMDNKIQEYEFDFCYDYICGDLDLKL